MERLMLEEMRRALQTKTGAKKLTNRDAAKRIFRGEDISQSAKEERLSNWNSGRALSQMRPSHILRLARVYQCTSVTEMFHG